MSNLSDFFDDVVEESKKEVPEEKEKGISPFDILNSIYYSRTFILDENTDKAYVQYLINKGLSMGEDTIFYAAEMSKLSHLTKNMHHDFLNGVVRKRKRYNKWIKSDKDDNIKIVRFFMCCSISKAKEVLSLLNESQVNELRTIFVRDYNGKI